MVGSAKGLTLPRKLFSFYRAAWNASADCLQETFVCLSVCPSVRPSVKCVNCEKTKETCANIFISHKRSFTLVLLCKVWVTAGSNPHKPNKSAWYSSRGGASATHAPPGWVYGVSNRVVQFFVVNSNRRGHRRRSGRNSEGDAWRAPKVGRCRMGWGIVRGVPSSAD